MGEKRSLSARVAIGTALAAGVASLVAVGVTVFVADRLVVDQEERRLREIAAIALREFTPDDRLSAQIEDEADELAPASIRVAVYLDGRFAGGERQLPNPPGDTCILHSNARACAMTEGRVRVVACAAESPRRMTAALYASAVAILVAAGAAALIGRKTTRWALSPLFELRDSLATIEDDPRSATLAGDDTVSEVAALRSALADLLARLGAALDAAKRFSADAAHELRTPLTAIRAELDLLAEDSLDASTAAAVERLRARTLALSRLVDRLLALARTGLESAEPVALEDVARDVVARVGGARVRLAVEAPGMVNGDEVLLAALVENAVDNALKFSGEAPVDVRVSEAEGRVQVDVIDDGPGLSPDDRARAFEPFFRAAAARAEAPGHGIGLAIVAQVAGAHGGAASFVDPEGRGAHLRVTLPGWTAK